MHVKYIHNRLMPNNKKQSRVATQKHYILIKEVSPEEQQAHAGDIVMIRQLSMLQQDLYTTRLVSEVQVTTTAAGLYNGVFGNSPSTGVGWTNLAAVFDEYRVLALVINFRPIVTTLTTYTFQPFGSLIDYDTTGAITSYTLGAAYSSYKEVMGNRPFRRVALMSGSENSQYITTATPVTTFVVKTVSVGNLPVSSVIGNIFVEYYVQFRGRGI